MTASWLLEFVAHACNFTFHRVYLVTFPRNTLVVDVSGHVGREYLMSSLALQWLNATMPNRWQNHTNRKTRDFGYGVITVENDILAFCRLEDAILAETQWGGTLLHG